MLRDAGSLRSTVQLGLRCSGEAGLSSGADYNARRDLNKLRLHRKGSAVVGHDVVSIAIP